METGVRQQCKHIVDSHLDSLLHFKQLFRKLLCGLVLTFPMFEIVNVPPLISSGPSFPWWAKSVNRLSSFDTSRIFLAYKQTKIQAMIE